MRTHHQRGRSGGWQQAQQPDAGTASDWIAGRLPEGWFVGDPTVVVDREEITVIGRLPEPEGEESEARASGRAARFREETRSERMRIADEAEEHYGRKVAWGIEIRVVGSENYERILFTHIAVPVMTRLKQPERQVLDTLVDAGVARTRWRGRSGWSASTPPSGWASCARRCRRSTTSARRARSSSWALRPTYGCRTRFATVTANNRKFGG